MIKVFGREWDADPETIGVDNAIDAGHGVHCKSSGGGAQTTVQKADPWSGQQPHLLKGFGEAERLFDAGGVNYFPGSTVTPFGTQSEQALNMMEGNALAGSPVANAGQDLSASTLRGDFLGGNPYLDQVYDRSAQDVTSRVNANFSGAGRTGSGAHQGVLADSLGDMRANLYGQNYANERNNQMQALSLAPTSAGLGYYDANQLANVGDMRDAKASEYLAGDINRHNFEQNQPYDNLNRYLSAVQGSYGGETATTGAGVQRNKTAGMAGGAMAGAQMGSSFGPWGTAIGAIGGGLLGSM